MAFCAPTRAIDTTRPRRNAGLAFMVLAATSTRTVIIEAAAARERACYSNVGHADGEGPAGAPQLSWGLIQLSSPCRHQTYCSPSVGLTLFSRGLARKPTILCGQTSKLL